MMRATYKQSHAYFTIYLRIRSEDLGISLMIMWQHFFAAHMNTAVVSYPNIKPFGVGIDIIRQNLTSKTSESDV